MSVDLTGGLAPEQDYVFGEQPENPEMRQGVSVWISNDDPDPGFGFPRLGLEAVASQWDSPGFSFQAAWPDGRVLVFGGSGEPQSPVGPRGLSTVIGAGPFTMRCVEPFHTWTADYAGQAVDTDVQAQIDNTVDRSRIVDVALHVEMHMAVPPWIQGTMGEAAKAALSGDTVEAAFMGGWRFEQLWRGSGSFTVGTEPEQTFTCSGLRIFRQGVRDTTGFWGHCWQSAVFPSGRAFGYIAYPPRGGGPPTYAECYVFEGDGELIPATLTEAPWMEQFVPHGGDVGCSLDSEMGTTKIAGETFVSVLHGNIPDFPPLHQGGVRYTWDGEETYGMIERSYPRDQMTW
ncbi:MAG TPA: hypothetical protein VH986_10095 [Acidimicrobiia bacterium]|jgi:hypothetical protein